MCVSPVDCVLLMHVHFDVLLVLVGPKSGIFFSQLSEKKGEESLLNWKESSHCGDEVLHQFCTYATVFCLLSVLYVLWLNGAF